MQKYQEQNLKVQDQNFSLVPPSVWPEDGEGIFRSSSKVATSPPVYHTR